MNNPAVIAIVLFSVLYVLSAAGQSEPLLPAPKFPFAKRAGDFATWTIVFKSSTNRQNDEASPRTQKEIRVVKTGRIRQEITIWSDGLRSEQWDYNGWVLVEPVGSTEIIILGGLGQDPAALYFPSHAKTDFPELDWLSQDTYVGVEKAYQRLCYVFQVAESSGLPTDPSVPSSIPVPTARHEKAWIDGETGLPLAIEDGGTLRIYVFAPPPTALLQLPSRFARAFRDYVNDLEGPGQRKMKL